MTRNHTFAVLSLFLLILFSCSSARQYSSKNEHNSRYSLDWAGSYKGLLPCADCVGITTVIQLNQDNTYQIQQEYEGTNSLVQTSSGDFIWEDNGNNIELKIGEETRKFQVGENRLFWLDNDGKRITGTLANNYVLDKEEKNDITEKYWKLVLLMGDTVKTEGTREAYIILKQDESLIGNGGCNAINGSYNLDGQDGISITGISSTEKACKAQATEEKLIQVLQKADSYLLKGDTLFLHKGRMVPLAKFEAVYLQ